MSEARLDKIEGTLDDIKESIKSIDVTMASQRIILKEHVKRTEALAQRFARVERHVIMVQGVIKFVFTLSLIATITAAVAGLIKGSL